MRKTGGAGGGAGGRAECEKAEIVVVADETTSMRGASAAAGSSVGETSTATAGGASRPQSQLELASDDSGAASAVVESQQECASGAGLADSAIGHESPSPQRPQAPAIGAAITSPGRSKATIAAVRKTLPRLIRIFEQYSKSHYFVNPPPTRPIQRRGAEEQRSEGDPSPTRLKHRDTEDTESSQRAPEAPAQITGGLRPP